MRGWRALVGLDFVPANWAWFTVRRHTRDGTDPFWHFLFSELVVFAPELERVCLQGSNDEQVLVVAVYIVGSNKKQLIGLNFFVWHISSLKVSLECRIASGARCLQHILGRKSQRRVRWQKNYAGSSCAEAMRSAFRLSRRAWRTNGQMSKPPYSGIGRFSLITFAMATIKASKSS